MRKSLEARPSFSGEWNKEHNKSHSSAYDDATLLPPNLAAYTSRKCPEWVKVAMILAVGPMPDGNGGGVTHIHVFKFQNLGMPLSCVTNWYCHTAT